MRIVSDFREAMWGVLQQGISSARRRFRGLCGRALRPAAGERVDAGLRAGAPRRWPTGLGEPHRRIHSLRPRRAAAISGSVAAARRLGILTRSSKPGMEGASHRGARPGGDHRRRRRRDEHRLPPGGAGLDRRRPRGSGRAHVRAARSTRAGLVGQLALDHDPDADDDVRRRRCTGGSPPRPGSSVSLARGRLAPPRVDPGALEELHPPGRLGQDVRAAARADLGRRGAAICFPLMSIDGVLGAVFLPTDGWLDPSGLRPALAAGARRRGAEIRTHARVVGIDVVDGRVTGVDVDARDGERRRSRPTSSSTPAACSRPEIGRARRRHTCRSCRWPTSTSSPRPIEGVTPALPTMRDPDNLVLLPRGGRRAVHGRLRAEPGAVGARRHPRRLQRPAPGPGLAPLRADHGRRHPAGPGHRRRRGHPDDQRAGGVHAGQRVHPRRERGPRASSSRPASAPTGSRARAGSASRWREWIVDGRARARPLADGHPAVRARSTGAAPTRWRGPSRTTPPTTTSTTRTRSAWPAARCASRPPIRACRARRRLRREVGLGARRTGSRPNEAGRRRRALRPRGWAGRALVAGDRRRGPGDARGARRSSTSQLRQDRGRRAGRGRFLQRLCANDVDRPVGADRLHADAQRPRRHRMRLHRDPARRRTASCS